MSIKIVKIIKIGLLLVIIPIFVFISCIEEYWPELDDDFDSILIVDGRITNEPGPYTVKLSKTSSLDSIPYGVDTKYDFAGLSGVIVSISDEAGNSETLTEIESGIYQTAASGIQGVVGEKYKITISTPGGKFYESTFEELLPPSEVVHLEYREEENISYINNEEIVDAGLQFYVTSAEASERSEYFLWEMEETYEYRSAYQIEHLFEGEFVDGIMLYVPPYNIKKVRNKDTLYYCWKTDVVKEIFTTNLNLFSSPKVEELPLNFISYSNEKLEYGYSLLVNQYTVTKNAHNYLKKIIDQNSNREGMFVSQPYQIRGNIANIEDPLEPVLGYFMAAAKNEGKRVKYEVPYVVEPDGFRNCRIIEYNRGAYLNATHISPVLGYLLFRRNNSELTYLTHAWVCYQPCGIPRVYNYVLCVVDPGCVDCRTRGGSIVKPDYWDME